MKLLVTLGVVATVPIVLLFASPSDAQSGKSIPGYALGSKHLASAPISLDEMGLIQKSLLFSEEDVRYLRMSRGILENRVEEILDVWYGFVGANDHLLASFVDRSTGEPDGAYLAAVRLRFGQWILDTADAEYDQKWLDYQIEIGRRHHTVGKNKTDGANSTPIIQFRYLQALTVPITTTLKPFLEDEGVSADEVEKMHAAWVKSVTLQVILWSHPYINDGEF